MLITFRDIESGDFYEERAETKEEAEEIILELKDNGYDTIEIHYE